MVILDAGAQYGKVIDRRVRELFVQSEIFPLETPAFAIREQGFRYVLLPWRFICFHFYFRVKARRS